METTGVAVAGVMVHFICSHHITVSDRSVDESDCEYIMLWTLSSDYLIGSVQTLYWQRRRIISKFDDGWGNIYKYRSSSQV